MAPAKGDRYSRLMTELPQGFEIPPYIDGPGLYLGERLIAMASDTGLPARVGCDVWGADQGFVHLIPPI